MPNAQLTRRAALTLSGISMLQANSVAATKPQPFIQGMSNSRRQRIAKLGEDFRSEYDLPGVSLAMAYRGKLKLLACFGYTNKQSHETVQPKHLFRVASVSKPITSVAILRLVEQGRLTLGDTVFASDGHLAKYGIAVTDAVQRRRMQQITIRHLLGHTGGGWSNKSGEAPMFASAALGMSHDDLIRWTVKHMPLQTEPGVTYAYSNFGYCLLGRIIETITRMPYEQAVKDLVLNHCGAKQTKVAHRNRNQRHRNEVTYYDTSDPYGRNMDVARMDAHGGWVSTPTDLVRIALHVDGFDTPQDILSSHTIGQMTTPVRGQYALGWQVNKHNNWWHTGGFNGGSSILARIHDGHVWSVVVNTRSRKSGYNSALDQFPWQVKEAAGSWGRQDLFASDAF